MLDITKELVSELHHVPLLSDIEVLAYTEEEKRIGTYKILAELKNSLISPKNAEQLRDWQLRRIKAHARKNYKELLSYVDQEESEEQVQRLPDNVEVAQEEPPTESKSFVQDQVKRSNLLVSKPMGLTDFNDIGRFALCLKKNPNEEDIEIARKLRLPLNRVAILRSWYMDEQNSK